MLLQRLIATGITVAQVLLSMAGFGVQADEKYPIVFVHGLFGWGASDGLNNILPYWGLLSGDMFPTLEAEGYECHAASVGPISSTWDRTCELYAQLTGTTVDYGEAHAEKYGHERYGRTYAEPMIPDWSTQTKIHLVGHSFGGATARLLTQLMAEGSEAERSTTPEAELSPLFTGGKADWVYSVTTIVAPHNGTTCPGAQDNPEDAAMFIPLTLAASLFGNLPNINGLYDFQLEQFGITAVPGNVEANMQHIETHTNFTQGGDNAAYELSLTGMAAVNEMIEAVPSVYYFSYTGYKTHKSTLTGNQVPDAGIMPVFIPLSLSMGTKAEPYLYPGSDNIYVDEQWLYNDGQINTISGTYPFREPHAEFTQLQAGDKLQPGTWYVMPVNNWDHLEFIGPLSSTDGAYVRDFYLQHLAVLDATFSQ